MAKRPETSNTPGKPLKRRTSAPGVLKNLRTIHILSDSTGNLAEHMLAAFLTQFPSRTFHLRRKTFLRSDQDYQKAFQALAQEPGIVFHAVVSPQAKKRIAAECRKLRLPHCDLTGQFVRFLAEHSGLTPMADPERLHRVDEKYQRRIAAVEYTLEHDDGLGLETIHEADIILVGISRTSKTPTSIYLAQQGYKVANIALALEVPPPQELFEAPAHKVVGLLIDPLRLMEIRARREVQWRMSPTKYADQEHIMREVLWSKRLFSQYGWKTVDVTNQAIEETAGRILAIMGLH